MLVGVDVFAGGGVLVGVGVFAGGGVLVGVLVARGVSVGVEVGGGFPPGSSTPPKSVDQYQT